MCSCRMAEHLSGENMKRIKTPCFEICFSM
jgi:hypothetical protein